MPKRVERWSDIAPPVTPLQRGTYLDACTAWIVAEPESNPLDAIETLTSDPLTHEDSGCDDVVARSSTNVREHRAWLCVVCRTPVASATASPQVGNPFSQHCYVVTCTACQSSKRDA